MQALRLRVLNIRKGGEMKKYIVGIGGRTIEIHADKRTESESGALIFFGADNRLSANFRNWDWVSDPEMLKPKKHCSACDIEGYYDSDSM
jgi:hypothetical protein